MGHPLCKLAFLKFFEVHLNRNLEHKKIWYKIKKENRHGVSQLTVPCGCSKYQDRTSSHSP